ncbi:carbohydrate sulfotransferase 4-like [Pseudophryne corroboree]|uniref:carbohydrate sulfotransferase 4-like n=1 Tax=Pseudophryne corroboree TaxID=495146 RepID=UPI003082085F
MSARSIYFFFLLVFIIFFLYLFPNISHLSITSSSSQTQNNPVHILILSSWRSGSSFVGQIFNHHHNVFYLFEPGYSVWMRFKKESAALLHYPVRDLFRSLFTCDVSPLQQYLPNGGQHISDMGFFTESRALCFPPACSAYIPSEGFDRQTCFHRCRNATLDKMEKACRMYSHVVMKTVRVLDLSVLLPLFQDPALDLRILHLVRDPRAVASSRKYFSLSVENLIVLKGINKDNKVTTDQVMMKICNAQVSINQVAKAVGHLLPRRYMLIRYEDLVREPIFNVKQMYDFADLKLNDKLEGWIYNITHDKAKPKGRFMSFSKQSAKVAQKWRTVMDFQKVKEIEQNCKAAMDLFGYLPVHSINDLKNMSLDLII